LENYLASGEKNMERSIVVSTIVVTLLLLVGGLPQSSGQVTTATVTDHACVNNSTGASKIVSETATCNPASHIKPSLGFAASQYSLFAPLSSQIITTTAGGFVGDGGPATSAGLAIPNFVVQDKYGNTYIADTRNYRIRKVTPSGTISTFAGTGIAGFSGDGGLARNAMLNLPTGLLFDAVGEMIIADRLSNRIRKIDRSFCARR
jgi:hypothetical protein